MRKIALPAVLLVVGVMLAGGSAGAGITCTPDPGPQAGQNPTACFPTPQECATGNYNGVYQAGPPGRGAVCVGGMDHIALYSGGNANTPCGVIIVADQTAAGDPTVDPNTCA